ncbi:MAG: hypothetical protein JW822_07650 [Spirochaetales bacterium]|nr:hypothetical protein [Spirochaetales bacterium]
MKLLNILIIVFFMFLPQTGLYAQNQSFEQFSNQFEVKVFEHLHLFLPISYVYDFHALDPYPYKGKKLDNDVLKVIGKKANDHETYYAVFKTYISHDIIGFIVREGGESQFFDSSLEMYIYDKKNYKIVQHISLAGYTHGESGGRFWAGWIEDINGDGCLDIVVRERFGGWDELEQGGDDSINVHVWQGKKYIEYTPQNIGKFLAAYPIFYNPFGSRDIALEDINKDLKQAENVYAIILSSDKSFEAARFEESRFEKEYTFHKRIFYYFNLLSCSIYKKNNKYYTTIGGDFSINQAELVLLDIKKIFPTAWVVDRREWCQEKRYNEEGYWECVK